MFKINVSFEKQYILISKTHLSLHKKAYRDILLIANGHEVLKMTSASLLEYTSVIDIYSGDGYLIH